MKAELRLLIRHGRIVNPSIEQAYTAVQGIAACRILFYSNFKDLQAGGKRRETYVP
jgi:hypothetical protein